MPPRRKSTKQNGVQVKIRLNLDDPEEAAAYEYLQRMKELGVDSRTLIVRALNKLDNPETDVEFMSDAARDLQATIKELQGAVGDLIKGGVTVRKNDTGEELSGDAVSSQLVSSVRKRRGGMM